MLLLMNDQQEIDEFSFRLTPRSMTLNCYWC